MPVALYIKLREVDILKLYKMILVMKKVFNLFIVFLFTVSSVYSNGKKASKTDTENTQSLAKLVKPEIGTEGSGLGCGFTYLGASYPFGMVQFTPSFFTPQRGFVINQMSGAGCPQMGNFPVLPMSGTLKKSPNDMNAYPVYKKINNAYAGYLSVNMEDDTKADFTVNKRSGIARFTFTGQSNDATVIIGSGINSTFVEFAKVKITSNQSCEGFAEGGEFCGEHIDNYRVYFAAEFDRPAAHIGTWKGNALLDSCIQAYGKNSGAWFTFDVNDNKEVNYRIAISYVSIENARQNLKSSDRNCSFDKYLAHAETIWNEHLGKITVESDNEDRKVQFYTSLYHSLIHPNIVSDVNGEYMGADYEVHTTSPSRDYYSTFSLWDTYRSQVQLLAMLFPKESSDMMQSRVDFAEQCGGFGRWILANVETGIMQGDPTPILIANAHAFGATDFDIERAYYHMKRGAQVPLLRAQSHEVRPNLREYILDGFTSASIMLEYSSSDYAIGQFAKNVMENDEDATYFVKRAQCWKNIYNDDLKWLCSKDRNGNWKDIEHDWREASYKNYFWMVPYDLDGLIDTVGGKDFAEKRLDAFFVRLDASYEDDWFAAGNEPNFQVPWVYNWTNAPYKATEVIHRIFNEIYSSSPTGLPGNEDVGAMGSWYVLASIGLYPVIPGVAGFSINLPQFKSIKVSLPKGDLHIKGGGVKPAYIQSLKINGETYGHTWMDWKHLQYGATIEYETAKKPNKKWGLSEYPSVN